LACWVSEEKRRIGGVGLGWRWARPERGLGQSVRESGGGGLGPKKKRRAGLGFSGFGCFPLPSLFHFLFLFKLNSNYLNSNEI
jgi:hypothetical protein